ncbi:cell division protein ZipA C-terminal FtsZ-binding domain-containing protein [Reinekea sp.]|uniref:cell division protein ZipA C-terminal FtsZ-binding domain-containing protein n=1 Tax=Reinekea sp. TaxID=1970455 RepID=UPI00257FEC2A|nr:cell division protein ZipA C-terminal FtsZ-binding domain-containing protein [Reinekea sp.]
MEIREIIVALGVLAIIVILIDGVRRMKIKIPTKTIPVDDDYQDPEELARKAQVARELPNGGARVVREMSNAEQSLLKQRLNLRERVPMLMERVEVGEERAEVALSDEARQKAALQSELDFTQAMTETDDAISSSEPEAEPMAMFNDVEQSPQTPEPKRATEQPTFTMEELGRYPESDVTEQPNPFTEADLEDEPYAYQESVSENDSGQYDAEPVDRYVSAAEVDDLPSPAAKTAARPGAGISEVTPESSPAAVESRVNPGPVEELVIMHIMAKNDGELSGSAVLELLLTAGLRHGPMEIFHYRNPQGYSEFSLANCVQPGTFNPDSMNQVNTPGVTLFMQLPTAANTLEAFDHMYEMGRYLAKHLDADMLDEDHNSVTPQRLEYYREKLRSFVRSKMIPT